LELEFTLDNMQPRIHSLQWAGPTDVTE